MTVYGIVAYDKGGGVGYKNGLPWKGLKEDMDRFKILTRNAIVVMGRKTYDSIPKRFKPLRDRINIVVTRQPMQPSEELYDRSKVYYMDVATVHDYIEKSTQHDLLTRIFIIGGPQIWDMFMDIIDVFYITQVTSTLPLIDAHIDVKKINSTFSSIVYQTSSLIRSETNNFHFFFEVRVRPGKALAWS